MGALIMDTKEIIGKWRRCIYRKEEGEDTEEATGEINLGGMRKRNMNIGQEEEDIIETKHTGEKKEPKKTKDGMKLQGIEDQDLEVEGDDEE